MNPWQDEMILGTPTEPDLQPPGPVGEAAAVAGGAQAEVCLEAAGEVVLVRPADGPVAPCVQLVPHGPCRSALVVSAGAAEGGLGGDQLPLDRWQVVHHPHPGPHAGPGEP